MKKILSLLLSVFLLASCLVMPAMAEEATEIETSALTEVEQSLLKEEFQLLEVLGLELDFSNAYAEMTRAELANLAIKMGGFSLVEDGEAVYSDVPRRHWSFASVNTVIVNGCMSGKTEYLFQPDEEATVCDGVRVMLGFLGYSNIVEDHAWTDAQCIEEARRIGLTKGTSIDLTGNVNTYTMAKLFLRCLELPVVEVNSVVADGALYRVNKNTRYITKRFDCYLKQGTVYGVEDFAIHGYNAPGKNKIQIDNGRYGTNGYDYMDFVGDRVEYIINGEDSLPKIIYMVSIGDEDFLEVQADDIIQYDNYQLTYFEKDRGKSANLSQNCQIILNGSEVKRYDERDFMPLAGMVRLKDLNSDGTYDLAFITYIIYYRVAGANEEGYLTDAMTGKQTKLLNNDLVCVDGGKIVDFDRVKNDAVVGVMPNAITYDTNGFPMTDNTNVTNVKLNLTANTATGQVNMCAANSCKVGDTEYIYSAFFAKLSEFYNIHSKLSATVTLYLDETGRIVAMKTTSQFTSPDSGICYGYLLDIGKTHGLDAKYIFKMIVDTATERVLECADTFYVNDMRNPSTLSNVVGLYVNGEVVPQLVAYRLDADGKISRFYTAVDRVNATITGLNGETITNPDCGDESYPGYDEEHFALNYVAETARYRAGFMHRYIVADTAVVFIVPADPTNTKLFKVTNKSYFTIGGKYPISVYDVDENYFIHSMVLDGSKGATSELRRSLYDGVVSHIVTGKAKTWMNEEVKDVVQTKTSTIASLTFSAYTEAQLGTETDGMVHSSTDYYKLYAGTAWEDLVPGDVIQIVKNESGEVADFRVIFRYADLYNADGSVKCQELINAGLLDDEIYNTVGVVTKIISDGSVIYNVDPDGNSSGIRLAREAGMERSYNRGMVRVFIYDSNKKTVTTGVLSDVQIGDAVMVRSEYGTACEMFVYR